jgi:hypothetical protein
MTGKGGKETKNGEMKDGLTKTCGGGQLHEGASRARKGEAEPPAATKQKGGRRPQKCKDRKGAQSQGRNAIENV